MPRVFTSDRCRVEVWPSRAEMGRAAGLAAAGHLSEVLSRQGGARVIFACAPSQDDFLTALTSAPEVDWRRVTAFHMDEYVGLPAGHSAGFRSYLRNHLTSRVRLERVHELTGDAIDPTLECERYAALLAEAPIDLACLGIGENGHIAFNDPPVANFRDPVLVKLVELDRPCRDQQVNDGCFPTLAEVPTHALTLTVPALMSARRICCVVPGTRKAAAVERTLHGPVAIKCPASILRTHLAATLYLDRESAAQLLISNP